jgi:uncharacterized protein YecE (DUF72 family)
MKLYIGTSGFSYSAWKEKFYPKDLPAKQMLSFYAGRFNSVEINNTFFRMPPEEMLNTWLSEVPADFCFAFKAPQRITHMQRLKNSDEAVAAFVESLAIVKKRLGPILFQLPPNFKADIGRLKDFIAILPKKRRFAFEFRHESWFQDSVFELLRRRNIALCIAEAEDGPNAPLVATADWGYLRLRRVDYTRAKLKRWSGEILSQKWSDAYVYFRHEDKALGPAFAETFDSLFQAT